MAKDKRKQDSQPSLLGRLWGYLAFSRHFVIETAYPPEACTQRLMALQRTDKAFYGYMLLVNVEADGDGYTFTTEVKQGFGMFTVTQSRGRMSHDPVDELTRIEGRAQFSLARVLLYIGLMVLLYIILQLLYPLFIAQQGLAIVWGMAWLIAACYMVWIWAGLILARQIHIRTLELALDDRKMKEQ